MLKLTKSAVVARNRFVINRVWEFTLPAQKGDKNEI